MDTKEKTTSMIEIAGEGQNEITPMQERLCEQTRVCVDVAANAILTEYRQQNQEDAGRTYAALFVP